MVAFIIILWIGGLIEDIGLKNVAYISIGGGLLFGVLLTMMLNRATED